MNILSWILFGLIIGFIAHAFDTSGKKSALVSCLLFGVGGALLGGFLANILLNIQITGFNLTSFIIAVTGSLGVLLMGRGIRKV